MTKEEREGIKVLAKSLGFKNTSQFIRYGLDFVFDMMRTKDDPSGVITRFMNDALVRMAALAGVQQTLPLDEQFGKNFIAALEQQVGPAVEKSFPGASALEKREGGVEPPASRLEAGHVT